MSATNLPSVDPPKTKKSKAKPAVKKTKQPPNESSGESKLTLAEKLCLRLADGEQLSPDDYGVFAELNWSRTEVERQVRRVQSIRELQRRAGSKTELTKKKVELADAKEVAAEETEQLDAQIQSLMDSRDAIQFEVRALEQDVTIRVRSMDELRTRIPPHVQRVHGQLVAQLKSSSFNRERIELRSEIGSLRGLPRQWSEAASDSIGAMVRSAPADELPPGILDSRGRVHSDKWREFAAGKLAKMPELETRFEQLEIEFQKRMAAVDQQLDFYLTD